MVALAVVVVVLWTMREVRRGANLSYDTILTAALIGIPSGVIISRLLHVVDMWDFYIQNPGLILGFEGLTIWGAVLGATLGIWIYSKFSNFRFGYFADLVTPGVILAQAVGRVGCTLNGCCYGTPTSLLWGVIYPSSIYIDGWSYYIDPKFIGVPVHPTQLYEIIYLLIIFGVVLSLRGRFKPDGSLFLIYLSLYAVWRVGIDFLRYYETPPLIFGLHQAQIIGIIVVLIAIPTLVLRTRWVKAETT
jgi:phosphatidylglycerol:prolipoprotein diacylglycerol transferase